MAEGGQLPWKVQHIDSSRGPAGDYRNLRAALPEPPKGVEWQQNEETKEWKLVKTEDEDIRRRKYNLRVQPSWNARRGRVEPTLVPVPKEEEEQKDDDKKQQPNIEKFDTSADASDSTVQPAVEGVDFLLHTVLPSDTLAGLCLRYRSNATTLRQINKFSGSNLLLAPSKLIIPLQSSNGESLLDKVRAQDTNTKEYKMQHFLTEVPHLTASERKAYLELSDWNLEEAILNAKEDAHWERSQDETKQESKEDKKVTKPKLHVHVAVPAKSTAPDKYEKDFRQQEEDELRKPLLMDKFELELARRDHP